MLLQKKSQLYTVLSFISANSTSIKKLFELLLYYTFQSLRIFSEENIMDLGHSINYC